MLVHTLAHVCLLHVVRDVCSRYLCDCLFTHLHMYACYMLFAMSVRVIFVIACSHTCTCMPVTCCLRCLFALSPLMPDHTLTFVYACYMFVFCLRCLFACSYM